jgi:peptidoglycan/xylan/chitin deacetylase (PgdA/CDA1 family)
MPEDLRRLARWTIAVLCHYSGADALYRHLRGPALAILMFHRVRDEPDPYPLSITRSRFMAILRWLRRGNYLTALDSGLKALAAGAPGTRYALTFDDGYRDNLALLDAPEPPPAVVYLATGHIGGESIWAYRLAGAVAVRRNSRIDLGDLSLGRWDLDDGQSATRFLNDVGEHLKALPADALEQAVADICARLDPAPAAAATDMLDWEQAQRLHQAGIEIGAHTVHHAILSRVPESVAKEEVVRSRDDVSRHVAPPRHFAYPNGGPADFGEREIALVREAGFATAVSTVEGVNRPGADPYRLRRHNVHEERFHSPLRRFSRALFFSETSGILDWLRTRRAA